MEYGTANESADAQRYLTENDYSSSENDGNNEDNRALTDTREDHVNLLQRLQGAATRATKQGNSSFWTLLLNRLTVYPYLPIPDHTRIPKRKLERSHDHNTPKRPRT